MDTAVHYKSQDVSAICNAVIQNAGTQSVITFFFVGLEVITGIICAVLITGLDVEKVIEKEQKEMNH